MRLLCLYHLNKTDFILLKCPQHQNSNKNNTSINHISIVEPKVSVNDLTAMLQNTITELGPDKELVMSTTTFNYTNQSRVAENVESVP